MTCSIDGCGRKRRTKGLCSGHYMRLWKHGDPMIGGDMNSHRPDGAGTVTKHGYVVVKKNGQAKFQHVRVMEQQLGRELRPEETVHHKNGIRSDNRPENLELWASSQPSGQRVEDLVAWAHEILDQYERGN